MSDFEIRGADEFLKLSKALKAAGHTGLRKELHKAMRDAAKPLIKDAQDAAARTFPKGKGLAGRESRIRFRPQVRTGKDPGVSVVAPGKYIVGKTVNATGRFRHPVFADPKKTRKDWTWHDQTVPGGQGWFDRRMAAEAPTVRPHLEAAIKQMAEKVVREVGRG